MTPTPDELLDVTSETARRDRRTRRAVATVKPSTSGIAACTGHRALFDRAEVDHPGHDILLRASQVCAICPLAVGCGFRVPVPVRASTRALRPV
ncbi:hypothetical protein OHA98_39885 [Streptomyces sp. NBC_00654]|uniref:hypothetical protein n=1 Tax=Streptomyces sp. NBC_00654 TaxID=2975799 RepID=UPI00225A6E4A|nr:hypothetical protein [Streptomyces sp. NBC_00654]MCX4970804.1 hypothetical protein [Streptomyces sp. NBC_00654]